MWPHCFGFLVLKFWGISLFNLWVFSSHEDLPVLVAALHSSHFVWIVLYSFSFLALSVKRKGIKHHVF